MVSHTIHRRSYRVNVVNARILGKDIDEIIPFFLAKVGTSFTNSKGFQATLR